MRLITLDCCSYGEMTFVVHNIVHIEPPPQVYQDECVMIGTADGHRRMACAIIDRVGGGRSPATYDALFEILDRMP